MFYSILRKLATFFLRIYFGRTWVFDKGRVPSDGPLIVASNHPSAFLEASLLATIMDRPLHFLVRGDMFHPRFRWLFDWTNQIPIYRQKDGIANLRKNASSFDLTYRKLGEGHAVLIFPEAKTLLEKRLRPVQRGTAHLAFGALPYLKEGDVLRVLPVGVNYIEPRQPGADVMVRFGEPFIVAEGSREDRDAIEAFTARLEAAMKPLVVNIDDPGHEPHYEVLASVYETFLADEAGSRVSDDIDKISDVVNHAEAHGGLLKRVHDYLHELRRVGLREAAFFPRMLTRPKWVLALGMLHKVIWLLAGGWLWRLIRQLVFSKIKAPTFQSPTAVGAAIVGYLLMGVVMAILSIAWYPWLLAVWFVLLAEPSYPPLGLFVRVLRMSGKRKAALRDDVFFFRQALVDILKPQSVPDSVNLKSGR